jgi:hypothetical protein
LPYAQWSQGTDLGPRSAGVGGGRQGVDPLLLACIQVQGTFADLELAEQARAEANEHITKCLRSKAIRRTCTFCNKVMDPLSRYSKCERCYRAGQRDYY